MKETIIVDALPGHVSMLCEALREEDAAEIAVFDLTPRQAVWASFRDSTIRRAAFVDGKIAAMWGVGGIVLGDEGQLWLLTTHEVERVPFTFFRAAREEIESFFKIWPRLTGVVVPSYTRAVRFLELLGFTLIPQGPYSIFTRGR